MKFTAGAPGTRGRKRLAVLLFALWSPLLWAGELEVGVQAVVGNGSVPGVAAAFSGLAASGVWLFGGYGSGLYSSDLSLAGGGALVGIRPLPVLTLLVKAGLGAGFHAGEAGATCQGGAEVAWGGPGWGITGSWERVWNLAELPSLPSSGRDVWSLGVRFRIEVSPH